MTRHPRIEHEAEVEDAAQDQQEDRDDEGELDQGLAAGALPAAGTPLDGRHGCAHLMGSGMPIRTAVPSRQRSHGGAWCVNGTLVLSETWGASGRAGWRGAPVCTPAPARDFRRRLAGSGVRAPSGPRSGSAGGAGRRRDPGRRAWQILRPCWMRLTCASYIWSGSSMPEEQVVGVVGAWPSGRSGRPAGRPARRGGRPA